MGKVLTDRTFYQKSTMNLVYKSIQTTSFCRDISSQIKKIPQIFGTPEDFHVFYIKINMVVQSV